MTSPTDTVFSLRLPDGRILTATATSDCELPDGRFAMTVGSIQPPSKLAALRALRDVAKPTSRRKRKPSVRSLVKQAERSGKQVSSVTTADGTTLHFGPPPEPIESNLWLDDLRRKEPMP